MTLYKDILKKSWSITIKNKFLWFFGIFSLILGSAGEYEVLYSITRREDKANGVIDSFIDFIMVFSSGFLGIGKRLIEEPLLTVEILLTFLFLFILFLFMVWLANISQIAIVDSNYKITRQKEANIKTGLNTGLSKFWPVLSLNIFTKLMIILLLALLAKFTTSILYGFVFLSVLFLLLVIAFITKYAIAYIVIRNEKIKHALILAYDLFKKNWLVSLELTLVLLAFTFFFVFVSMLVMVTALYFMAFLLEFFNSHNDSIALYFSALIPILLLIIFTYTLSLLSVFQISAWTNLFIEIDVKGAKSKLERMFTK